jgi:uncharacterized damage-inducible protein DinB
MLTKSVINDLNPSHEKLISELTFVGNYADKELDKLNDENLDEPLAQTKFPHLIAKTKYEALTWNFKHEMWHLGQISTIKRILGNPIIW